MMTPEFRKLLQAKRKELVRHKDEATARANQAAGGIQMLDALLALPDNAELPPEATLNGDAAGADATH